MHRNDGRNWRRHLIGYGVCAALLITVAGRSATAEEEDILRVEVDWEVKLHTPDSAKGTPELIFVLSPYAHVDSAHSVFAVNHRDETGHQVGGFQNQVWSGETLVRAKKGPNDAVLSTPGEFIHFTHVMQVNAANGKLDFDVINLQSSTWGNLTGDFANTYIESGITKLSQFSVTTLINETGIQAGGNRVDYIELLHVRKYTQYGLDSDVHYHQQIYDGLFGSVPTVETVDSVGEFVSQ